MVYQLLLGFQPFCPAIPTDRIVNPLAELVWKWLERLALVALAAPAALDRFHPAK
ncbi:MAG TPA: hypothetical protein VGM77_05300 [Gemmatimonadales bacterium]|jgi:hypothetical protein